MRKIPGNSLLIRCALPKSRLSGTKEGGNPILRDSWQFAKIRGNPIIAVGIGLVAVIIALYLYFKPHGASAAPWSTLHGTYMKRKQVTLTNNSGATLHSTTTYKISIDTKALYDSGEIQSDCDDLRIVYQPDDSTALELERNLEYASGTTCATSTATKVVFALQADLSDSASSSYYYLYYDNPTASSYSSSDALDAYNIGSKEATFIAPFNGTTTALAVGSTSPTTETGAIRYSGSKSALSFDGAGDNVAIGNASDQDVDFNGTENFTLEAWIYPKNIPAAGYSSAIISKWDTTSTTRGYYLALTNDDSDTTGNLEARIYDESADQYLSVVSTNDSIAQNTWYHLMITFNGGTSGSANDLKLYINGTYIDGNDANGSFQGLEDISADFIVGDWDTTDVVATNTSFGGIIDEIRISNIIRNSSNFTPPASAFIRDEYTKLLLHFDENGDDPRNSGKALDDSGNNNHGTITGAKYVSGLVGVDGSVESVTGSVQSVSFASHEGIFIEEGTTNKITNPGFEHATYNTNWYNTNSGTTSFFDYDSTADTFTAGLSKRSSAGPFAAGWLVQGDYGTTDNNSDSITYSRGTQIYGNFYSNADTDQGSIVFWVTPEWNGNDGFNHAVMSISSSGLYIYKSGADSKLYLVMNLGGWRNVSVDISSWTAGTTYQVVARWDSKNTLDGTNYLSLTVNDSHTFAATGTGTPAVPDSNITLGKRSVEGAADALIEGLSIYRRPLFDGTYGIDVGNGDEIAKIYDSDENNGNGITSQDPTLVTGSWDIVFALPTNASTGSLGVGSSAVGEAWSHPHASNLLYTSTTNTGGFMMNGTYTADGWTSLGVGTTEPSFTSLDASEKIFSGGYKWTNNIANQGIGTTEPVTAGADVVIRALAHSDGTAVPKIIIYDNTNGAEIGSLTGTSTSTRTDPDTFIFTGEAPDGYARGWVQLSGQPSDGDTVTIDSLVYTFKSSLDGTPGAGEIWVLIGTNYEDTGTNLDKAIDNHGTLNTHYKYGSGAGAHTVVSANASNPTYNKGQVRLQAKSTGAGGNVALSETAANTTVSGSTLTGGQTPCTNVMIKLLNTQSSGTVYWHQVELLNQVVDDPSITTGWGDPWIPRSAGLNYGLDTGESSLELSDTHSGNTSAYLNANDGNELYIYGPSSGSAGSFNSWGFWVKEVSNLSSRITGYHIAQYLTSANHYWYMDSASWKHYSAVSRSGTSGSFQYFMNHGSSYSAHEGYLDDIYVSPLTSVSLTVAPANETNSTETSGIRVDGTDTLTQTIDTISAASGDIRFKATPRHSFATADLFGNTSPVIAAFYGDSDDYIKLYRYDDSTLRLTGVFNGTTVNADYSSPTLDAGTSYDFRITYENGGNLVLYVDFTSRASASGVVSFSTTPTTAYFGSDNTGANQYDLTIAAPSTYDTITASENTATPYYKFGSKSLKLVALVDETYATSINAGNTNTHTFSAYVYDGTTGNIGGTVSSSIASLVFNGSVQTTTYSDMGGGWWRLSCSGTAIASAQDFGLQVKSGKTVYVDGVQLEEKAYSTTYADGSLGDDYAWTGTANDSTSTRTVSNLQFPTGSNLTAAAGSYSFWIKPREAVESIIGDQYLFDIRSDDSNRIAVYLDASEDDLTLNTNGTETSSTGTAISAGAWVHLVLTWDFTNDQYKLYQNGNSTPIISTTTSLTAPILPANFVISGDYNNASKFNGMTTEIRNYSSVLTSTEVSDLYYAGLGSHSEQSVATERFSEDDSEPPVLVWHFNEGYGTTAHDSTDYQNNGIISGSNWSDLNNLSNSSKSLQFDGTNDYVYRTYSADTELDPNTASMSASLWFKAPATVPSSQMTLLSRYNSSGYKIYMNTSGYVCFGVDDDSSWGPDDSACTTTSYADSKWHHLEAVKGSTNIALYIDARQKASTAFTVSESLSGGNPTLYVGIDSNGVSYPWKGFLDDIRLYDSERNESQIKQEYNDKTSGTIKGVSVRLGGEGAAENLTDGLVGYWKMDESTANTCTGGVNDSCDSSGYNLDLYWTNQATSGTGKFGKGTTYDGVDDMASCTDANCGGIGKLDFDNNDSFTISAWFKTSNTSTSSWIVGKKGRNLYNYPGYAMEIHSGGWVQFWIGDNTNQVVPMSINTYNNGVWHQAILTYDGNTKQVGIYVDGIYDLDESICDPETGAYCKDITLSGIYNSFNSTYPLSVGLASANNSLDFNGQIDEVRIYNRSLSSTEVRALYEYAPGPVAYYKSDEGSGQIINDSSGNNLNGTLGADSSASNNDPAWDSGKFGKALKYDGIDDYSLIPTDSKLDISHSITLMAWVKPKTINYSGFNQIFVKTTGTGVSDRAYYIRFAYCSPNWAFLSSNTAYALTNWSLCAEPDEWMHIAGTYDGTSQKLYVNGVMQGNIDRSNQLIDIESTAPLYMGSLHTSSERFDGIVDEIKIYNYARTPKQIVSDMNAGHPAVGSPIGSAYIHYKFDEGYESSANNSGSGGSTLNGTIGSGAWTNDGKFGKAVSFTASTSVTATITDPAYSHTLSLWVYPVTSAAGKTLVTSGMLTTDADSKPVYGGCTGTALSLNTWTHLVAVSDGSGICKIFQNGKLTSSSTTGVTFGTSLNIGGSSFTGYIDDFKLYYYPLSEDEVKIDYNQGKAIALGSLSDTSQLSGGSTASNSASAAYCVPGNSISCTSPVTEWKLDENYGTTVYDTSGRGYSGTFNSSPYWKAGKQGSALEFDGIDDYVLSGDINEIDGVSALTISAWVKLDTLGKYATVFSKRVDNSHKIVLQTSDDGDSGDSDDVMLTVANGSANYAYTNSNILTADTWQYWTMVYDGSQITPTNRIKFYLNGISKAVSYNGTTPATGPSNSQAAYIGSESNACSPGYCFLDGLIDDLKIFNYARTPAQIAWDYNRGAPVAHYKMDECTDSTLHSSNVSYLSSLDATIYPQTNDNTSAGTCDFGTDTEMWNDGTNGKFNGSLGFDGDDDYGATGNLALNAANAVTYTTASWGGWIFPTTSIASKTLIHKNNEFRLTTDANGKPQCEIYSGSWQTAAVASSALSLSDWSHVLCTYDGANIKVFLNGQQSGSSQAETNAITSSSSTALNLARDSAGTGYFEGLLDDVRIYNYALTPVQIKTLYNNSSSVQF